MTLPMFRTRKCFVCGNVSRYTVMASTSEWGDRDLDFRPSEPRRSSMWLWVQECPGCGYVSSDVSRGVPFLRYVRSLIQSDDYLKCGDIPFGTELAKLFFRQFYLLFEEGRLYAALDAIQAAAWCCDDAEEAENAKKCRFLALKLLQSLFSVEESEEKMSDSEDAHETQLEREALFLIRVDLLRRTGQFDDVIRSCTGVQLRADRMYESIAKYQVELALQGDTSCHSVEDAVIRFPLPGYRYYSVRIEERSGRSFYYLAADGEEYVIGDSVLVPFGERILKGTVIHVEDFDEDDLPLALDKMKTICGPCHVEINRSAADYQPQAAANAGVLTGIFQVWKAESRVYGPADTGYEWLKPGECCIFVPNPFGDEPLSIHCGDDFTVLYREWYCRYDYPLTKDPATPLEHARNDIARRSLNKLYEHLLGFVECRISVVMAYIGDSFVGGAFVNSTTARRSVPEVLLSKVTSEPEDIQRAREEGARLEVRHWQSMLDHIKWLEARKAEQKEDSDCL